MPLSAGQHLRAVFNNPTVRLDRVPVGVRGCPLRVLPDPPALVAGITTADVAERRLECQKLIEQEKSAAQDIFVTSSGEPTFRQF